MEAPYCKAILYDAGMEIGFSCLDVPTYRDLVFVQRRREGEGGLVPARRLYTAVDGDGGGGTFRACVSTFFMNEPI